MVKFYMLMQMSLKHFGLLSKAEQLDIITSFVQKDEQLLFQYFPAEIESISSERKEYIKQEYFEDYCMDILSFKSTKVKGMIDAEVIQILEKSILDTYGLLKDKIILLV